MVIRRFGYNATIMLIAGATGSLAIAAPQNAPASPPLSAIGIPSIANTAHGTTTIERGALLYFDGFTRYPLSSDPIFDRFQIEMEGLPNGTGGAWRSLEEENIPTLFVEDQFDANGIVDPLPRWQGADLIEGSAPVVFGDLSGDLVVDTVDLGKLLGAFGLPTIDGADLNEDGFVDTADLGLLVSAFGDTAGPYCLYEVSLVRDGNPAGDVYEADLLSMNPLVGEVIAIPASMGICGLCDQYRHVAGDGLEPVYGTWALLESDAASPDDADYLADVVSQSCAGWGENPVLSFPRTETDKRVPSCCLFSLFCPLARQTTATPTSDVVTQADLYLTGHQTFLWLEGINNTLAVSWDVMFGGVVASLDPNLFPFANAEGNLDRFVIRQSPTASGTQFGLFFGTIPDSLTGAVGKRVLINEWMSLRMTQKANSTFEFWVRDSETMLLPNPNPGSDFDGVSDDGFARLVPDGPYGPPIWNLSRGVPAPNPFVVSTPSFRQLQWLWGGDPAEFEDPDYVPANWFMDNIRIRGPF